MMKTNTKTKSHVTIVTNFHNGAVSTYNDTLTSDAFVVSGFGPNDGVQPTAGDFTRTYRQFANGSYHWSGGGTSEGGAYAGVLDGRVLQSFASVPTWSLQQNETLLRNQCLKKLYDGIRNSDLNLGTDTGESGESKELLDKVRRPVTTVAEGLQQLAYDLSPKKRGKYGNAVALTKSAANIWLTAKLALQPAADELDHLVHHSLEKRLNQPITVKARKSCQDGWVDASNITGGYNGPTVWSRRRTVVTSRRYEISTTFRVVDPNLFDLSRVIPLNPFSLAWELAPLSFVVDWAFDVGGFLQSLEGAFGIGLAFQRGYETSSSYSGEQYRYICPQQVVNSVNYLGSAKGSRVITTKKRTVIGSFPIPSLPRFTNPFHSVGTDRLLTAASLLAKLL